MSMLENHPSHEEKSEHSLEVTQTPDGEEIILNVSKEIASSAPGFVVDGGNSVTKLLYRSRKDYEYGKPKDVSAKFGKLRLKIFDHDAVDELIEFLKNHCDIIHEASHGKGEGGSENQTAWYQHGMTYTNWKNQLEENLNIRTTVLSESLALLSAIRGFYMKRSTCDEYDPQYKTLPISEAAVGRGRDSVLALVNTCDEFRSYGEAALGALLNRPREGFDIIQYKKDLMTKSVTELASDLQLSDINYPFLLIGLGSLAQIYLVNEDGSCVMLDYMTTSSRTFYNISRSITAAKDFNELTSMVSRGKSHRVDESTSDITNTRSDWYAAVPDGFMMNSAGKLGQTKYEGTYTEDDIAASLALSFCATTAKTVILHARRHNIKSVLFSGTVLSHFVMREYLDEAFGAESFKQPFQGGDVIKMGVLANPGHACALGVWRINWELEQQQRALVKS